MMEDPLQDAELRRKMSADTYAGTGTARAASYRPPQATRKAPSRITLWIWILVLTAGFVAVLVSLSNG